MSKPHGDVLNAGSDLTELTHRCARSFIAKYYYDDIELFDLFWGAVKDHIENISEKGSTARSILRGIGFAASRSSTELLLVCCATVNQFLLNVSRSEERPLSSKLKRQLVRAMKVCNVEDPLRRQMMEHLIPFAEEVVDSLWKDFEAKEQEAAKRLVIISGQIEREPMTKGQIEAKLISKDFDLAVDEKSKTVYVNGTYIHLGKKPVSVLVTLLKNFGQICTHEDILESVWKDKSKPDDTKKKRISFDITNGLIKANDIFKNAIESVEGIGYRINRTGNLKRFFLATNEPASSDVRI